MKKVVQIAVREFVATLTSRAFLVGLLIMPAMMALIVLAGPLLFNIRNIEVQGAVAIIDPTGSIAAELRAALDAGRIAERRREETRQALSQAPDLVRQTAETGLNADRAIESVLGPVPDVQMIELPPDADIQQEKQWLTAAQQQTRRLAIVVIHPDAVVLGAGKSEYGSYDLYVPPNLDDRIESLIQQSLREAVVNARFRARGLDRYTIDAMIQVPRVRSLTVIRDSERQTVSALNLVLPAAFGALLFIGVMTGGQALLMSTVEEKSSRIAEVLLSAVSPMELMAGKILGQMGVSLVVLGLYIVIGLGMLTSFALLGLLNPWLILYLIIFFLIAYLVMGSLMMAVGSAVNETREAQSLMMPITLIFFIPWLLWMPITRAPDSAFSIAISFIPPVNTFAMLLRMASSSPPPWWQIWLSIAIGVASVFVALWFAAKVFRIGLLMYGKPPNLATLIRWARQA